MEKAVFRHFQEKEKPRNQLISGFLVREAGLEPARPEWTLEPESSESANSTTRASLERLIIIAPRFPLVNTFVTNFRDFFFTFAVRNAIVILLFQAYFVKG